ncbi:hypothetical protein BDW02DRAFT_650986 [Decorospora gaudefroyi]|uniref:Uncharacterized protein n=1 Tax=Decorospora gaudefroyi TaxID=184978 RepID=A0A6A5JZJ6_9PLEO|nr:hypothetical protein BDW02DRAFT_650986 [Decorospora gaudefroyi]
MVRVRACGSLLHLLVVLRLLFSPSSLFRDQLVSPAIFGLRSRLPQLSTCLAAPSSLFRRQLLTPTISALRSRLPQFSLTPAVRRRTRKMERGKAGLDDSMVSSVDRVNTAGSLPNPVKAAKRKRRLPIDTTSPPLRRGHRAGRGHKTTGNRPTRPARLLLLPREIRNCIYHHAFEGSSGTVIQFRQGNITIAADYGTKIDMMAWRYHEESWHPLENGLPTWLLMNKQVLIEALEFFHLKARFFYTINLAEPLIRHLTSHAYLSLERAVTVHFSTHRMLGLEIEQQTENESGHKHWKVGLWRNEKAILEEAISHLTGPSPAVQSLTLRFSAFTMEWDYLPTSGFDPIVHDIRSRLGLDDQLPKSLMHVSFALRIRRAREENGQVGHILAAVKNEMRRLAMLVVDNPGVKADESEICQYHKHSSYPSGLPCQSDQSNYLDSIWRFEATSAAYRRSLAFERI